MNCFFQYLKGIILPLLLVAGVLIPSYSQVGINNPNPDSSAALDIRANDKGLLIPRMSTVDRTNLPKPANALLVFDKDQKMFFMYDSIAGSWKALNPLNANSLTSNITTASTGNFGIGTSTPTAKLDVNGNIHSSGSATVAGQVSAGSVTTNGNINATGSISSSSTVTANNFVGYGTIPIGGIIMWSGSTTSIPAGWKLCDGTSGTPNLANRFILSYGGASGSIGSTGGQNSVTLSVANLPPHQHDFSDRYANPNSVATGSTRTRASDDTYQTGTTSDGSEHGLQAAPFDNRPAYFVLAFIMRVQ